MSTKETKLILNSVNEQSISKEMESSFIDYAMSVIVSRAIPDARDGLKPVHRRILYAMNGLEMYHNRSYKKSARVVGEVLAKYHPHGDSSVYEAMVRMAQPFSMRYPLINGQGNFGSIDGDSAAAMRYTEAKLQKISSLLLDDLNKNTVDFQENYDASEVEPVVLPARLPNLLLNGSTGIAVGMATSIPPHNLTDLIDASIHLARHPQATTLELMQILKAPDFPTGGIIVNTSELLNAYETGRGRVVVRAKTRIDYDESQDRGRIIVTEIPYMVNKADLVIRITELVKDKVMESISELKDESSREGIRVVIQLKRGYIPEVELNKLFKLTALQTSFPINLLALVNQRPETLSLRSALHSFVEHQVELLVRRTKFMHEKAEARKHILEGLNIALSHIDAIIEIIKKSSDNKHAIESLMHKFGLSEEQGKAILEMKLSRLTGLERKNLQEEIEKLMAQISEYNRILSSRHNQIEEIITELISIRDEFGDARKTELSGQDLINIHEEDLIPMQDVVITMSKNGYVKRIPIEEYRVQSRGGVGAKGVTVNEDDYVADLIVANTHTDLLFFTAIGRVFKLRGHNIPEGSKTSKGLPIINLIQIEKGERIKAMLAINDYTNKDFLFFTENGLIKRTSASEYARVNRNGKAAITLRDDDHLLGVTTIDSTNPDLDVLIGNTTGKTVRFKIGDVRPTGRTSSGVYGLDVDTGKAIDFATVEQGSKVLALSARGYGKLTDLEEYRITKRGGKGVNTINTDKAGKLVALKTVHGDESLILITDKGTTIRLPLDSVSELSRNTKGVRIINLKDNERIASAAVVKSDKEIEQEIEKTVEVRLSKTAEMNLKGLTAERKLPPLYEEETSEDEINLKDNDDSEEA